MELSLGAIERATGSSFGSVTLDREQRISGWSIDSRTVNRGDLFFAIAGERFDGHDFLRAAWERGAAGVVVEKPPENAAAGGLTLQVESTVKALQDTARAARAQWGKRMVAVTGSAGKTSTKEIIAALLGVRWRVGKTEGNLNNHLGLPLTILRLPDEAEAAVVELGMNHAGEIRALAKIARPEIGVVTNVGYAHIEAFDSIEGIAAAKRELIEELPPEGVGVLNADDARVRGFASAHRGRTLLYGTGAGAEVHGEKVEISAEGARFEVAGVRFTTRLTGRHAVSNVLAGIAVAGLFGIAPAELTDAVAELRPGKMRGERHEWRGVLVLNDAYNSNPDAARSMLDVLMAEPARRRIAVLGEMLELGEWAEALHRDVGRYAADAGVDVLIGVRGASRHMVAEAIAAGMGKHADACSRAALFFDDAEEAGEFLKDFVRPGDAVLFKGSRGTHVERALARMEE